jgi:hypothetical protein
LANLDQARRSDRPAGPVKREAGRIPWQTAKRQQPARLAFDVGDHVFVARFQHHARRQDPPPMLHQRQVSAIKRAEFSQIVSVMMAGLEQRRETGERIWR